MEISSSQLNCWIDSDLNEYTSSQEGFKRESGGEEFAYGQAGAVDNQHVSVGSPVGGAILITDDLENEDTQIDVNIKIMSATYQLDDYSSALWYENAGTQELGPNEELGDCDTLEVNIAQPSSPISPSKVSGKTMSREEEILLGLDVKGLNKELRLSGLPPQKVRELKCRRRTLKNRCYAQKSRSKRIARAVELELLNDNLVTRLERMKRKRDSEKARAQKAEAKLKISQENLENLQNFLCKLLQQTGSVFLEEGKPFTKN